MDFLPPTYEPPSSSGYLKLQIGKTTIRIMGPCTPAWLFWRTEGESRKPIRRRMGEKIDPSELQIDPRTGEKEKPKHIWLFVAWNYGLQSIQIAEISQASIRDAIHALIADSDWGSPVGTYDLKITKSGSGLDTAYGVLPSNKSPTSPEILAAYKATPINLDALFSGGDPFAAPGAGHSPAAPRGPQTPAAPTPAEISRKAAFEALKATLPNATPEVLKAKWLELVKMHFGPRPQAQITAPEWTQVASELQYAGEEVPPIVNDDIPF